MNLFLLFYKDAIKRLTGTLLWSRENTNCRLHESFDKVPPSCLPVFVFFRDVLPQNFDSYSSEVQKLICTADHLGALMQYETPGFLPNRRIHRGTTDTLWGSTDDLSCNISSKSCVCFFSAMGLATLEVMQAMHRTWSNSKVRVNGKTRQMQWRDMFDIAVKWRRWGVFLETWAPLFSLNNPPFTIIKRCIHQGWRVSTPWIREDAPSQCFFM